MISCCKLRAGFVHIVGSRRQRFLQLVNRCLQLTRFQSKRRAFVLGTVPSVLRVCKFALDGSELRLYGLDFLLVASNVNNNLLVLLLLPLFLDTLWVLLQLGNGCLQLRNLCSS